MTQHQSFTLSQVLAICEMVAPTATIADIRKAIATQTAQDNAPQSQTRETASTAPTAETAETPSPAIVNPERNDAKPKKPTKAELAAAYNRIQAYVTHDGKTQIDVVEDGYFVHDEIVDRCVYLSAYKGVSERKWNAISLSIRKAVETLSGERMSDGELRINASAWAKAKKAAKKAAK